jgi:hypothetical protein
MRFKNRDGLWLTIVVALLAYALMAHRSAVWHRQISAQRQAELSVALQKQTEVAASVDQLRLQIENYETHGELIRRFLLAHLERRD